MIEIIPKRKGKKHTLVIEGVNLQDIPSIAWFASGLSNLLHYELLFYHSLGLSKARAMKMESEQFSAPDRSTQTKLANRLDIPVLVNGASSDQLLPYYGFSNQHGFIAIFLRSSVTL